mgnify:CR=1 FL=1
MSNRKELIKQREQFEKALSQCRRDIQQAGLDELKENTGVGRGSIVQDVTGMRFKITELRFDKNGNLTHTIGKPWKRGRWDHREEYIYGRYELARE